MLQPSGLRWMLPSHRLALLQGTICATTAHINFSSTFILCLISIALHVTHQENQKKLFLAQF
jgi:hypothetical protein